MAYGWLGQSWGVLMPLPTLILWQRFLILPRNGYTNSKESGMVNT